MKKEKNMRNKMLCILLISLVAIIATVGAFVYAKYVSEKREEAVIKSSVFHISSDYLDESGPTYEAFAQSDGIHFVLNNYEKENVVLISQVDISYEITVKVDGADKTDDFILANDSGIQREFSGTLPKDTKESQNFWLKPRDGIGMISNCTVIVKTTSPYEETISATFTFIDKSNAEIFDAVRKDANTYGDRYVVTVKTNAYNGKLRMRWNDTLVPDNTNIHMNGWNGTDGIFDVEPYTTYTFIFFNPNKNSYNKSDFGIEPAE